MVFRKQMGKRCKNRHEIGELKVENGVNVYVVYL
jgi:hypothetical protein